MPLATKNNAIIVKDGLLAENCDCCGGWYCDSKYGCCIINGVATSNCEEECVAAGGIFHGAGSVCCTSLSAQFLNNSMPASITLSFAGSKPKAYGHGCTANPSGTTVDLSYDNSAGWSPLDVFALNNWPDTIVLTRTENTTSYSSYGWNGGGIEAPSSANATVTCSHTTRDGRVAWVIASLTVESWSRNKCIGRTNPSEFSPNGANGISSALIWNLSATCSGTSLSGVTAASQSITNSNGFGLGVADPLRPQPRFCNLDILGWSISSISFTS